MMVDALTGRFITQRLFLPQLTQYARWLILNICCISVVPGSTICLWHLPSACAAAHAVTGGDDSLQVTPVMRQRFG
jgi:hypothetical protein